jgi:hypothetical protein
MYQRQPTADNSGRRTVGAIAMRRLSMIVALGALLGMLAGAVTASPALARGDGWSIGPPTPYTLDAQYCGFPVLVTPVVNGEYTKTLKAADGFMTFLFTGPFTASLTNLQTGKTVTEKMNGPGQATVYSDGSITEVHTGLNGPFPLAPADAQRFGLPGLSVTVGKLAFSIGADGAFTSLTLNGHVAVDLCAALS